MNTVGLPIRAGVRPSSGPHRGLFRSENMGAGGHHGTGRPQTEGGRRPPVSPAHGSHGTQDQRCDAAPPR